MVTHEHVALERLEYLKRDSDKDQNGSTAQSDLDSGELRDHDRKYRDEYQEQGSYDRYLADDLGDELGSRLSGSDTRDHSGVLPQVIGDLNGIILNRNVEIVERYDQQGVERRITSAAGSEPAEECSPASGDVEHILDSRGYAQQRRGKDDRHNA